MAKRPAAPCEGLRGRLQRAAVWPEALGAGSRAPQRLHGHWAKALLPTGKTCRKGRKESKSPRSEIWRHLLGCTSPWGTRERWLSHDKAEESQEAPWEPPQVVQLFSRRWAWKRRHRPKKKPLVQKEQSQARKNLREYNSWSVWAGLSSL